MLLWIYYFIEKWVKLFTARVTSREAREAREAHQESQVTVYSGTSLAVGAMLPAAEISRNQRTTWFVASPGNVRDTSQNLVSEPQDETEEKTKRTSRALRQNGFCGRNDTGDVATATWLPWIPVDAFAGPFAVLLSNTTCAVQWTLPGRPSRHTLRAACAVEFPAKCVTFDGAADLTIWLPTAAKPVQLLNFESFLREILCFFITSRDIKTPYYNMTRCFSWKTSYSLPSFQLKYSAAIVLVLIFLFSFSCIIWLQCLRDTLGKTALKVTFHFYITSAPN